MKVGIIGLGKMGGQMVARLTAAGHDVVATDHHQENLDLAKANGAVTVPGSAQVVAELGENPVVWLMIAASKVGLEIGTLLPLMPNGGLIIDGGNSHYTDTLVHAATAKTANVDFIDVGTSGGILGLEHGFSMMIGGDTAVFERIQPLIEALAQPGGWGHFGPAGSGHFIKMVHNGIEYGMMQAYAEGYRVLQEGHELGAFDLAKIGEVWEHGSIIASNLNALTTEVLKTNPTLSGIEGYVAKSGEADWTIEAARAKAIAVPVIEASVQVRNASKAGEVHFGTKLLAAMRNAFGGHNLNRS